jgi:endonuclease I
MKHILRLFFACAIFIGIHAGLLAQIPAGYYNSAAGLSGLPLQIALHNIIKNHTVVSYGNLYTKFKITDTKGSNVVWDMYSDVPGGTPPYIYHYVSSDECGSYVNEGDCFNREHSFPQSLFGSTGSMYSDMFHLYPTDGKVNGQRSNYPMGEVAVPTWTSLNGSKVGDCTFNDSLGHLYPFTAFEPIDEYKGDFARTFFYIAVRYYTEDAGWTSNGMNTGAQMKPWAIAQYLKWSHNDPVSTKETNRNNGIYGIQDNRNPFIDHP